MSVSPPPDQGNDEFWREYLPRGSPSERRARQIPDLDPKLERRRLELKGKQELTEVVTLSVGPSPR